MARNTDSLSQAWQPRGGLSVMSWVMFLWRLLLSKHEPAFNQEKIKSASKPEGAENVASQYGREGWARLWRHVTLGSNPASTADQLGDLR